VGNRGRLQPFRAFRPHGMQTCALRHVTAPSCQLGQTRHVVLMLCPLSCAGLFCKRRWLPLTAISCRGTKDPPPHACAHDRLCGAALAHWSLLSCLLQTFLDVTPLGFCQLSCLARRVSPTHACSRPSSMSPFLGYASFHTWLTVLLLPACSQGLHEASKLAWLHHKLAKVILAKAPVAVPGLLPKLLTGSVLLSSAAAAALSDVGRPASGGAPARDSGEASPSGRQLPFRFTTDSPLPRDMDLEQANAAFSQLQRDPIYQWASLEAPGNVSWSGPESNRGDNARALEQFAALSSGEDARAWSPASVSAHASLDGSLSEDAALLAFANLVGPEGSLC